MFDRQSSRVKVGIVAAVLIASGLLFLVLPVVALQWAAIPFPGFFLDPNLVINDGGSAIWAGKRADPPLAYPERVVAVNDTAVATNADFFAVLDSLSPNENVDITLSLPPGDSRINPTQSLSERTVTLPLSNLSRSDLWNQFWLFYVTGWMFLAIGAWTFWMRPQAEAAQVFALLTAMGALTIGLLFDQVTSQRFLLVWVVALPLTGGFLVWLASIFPHKTRIVVRFPWLKVAHLGTAVVAAVWSVMWLALPGDPWAYVIPWRLSYFVNGAALVVSLAVMAYRGIDSASLLVRQQGRLIFWGQIAAFIPILLFFLTAAAAIRQPWLTPTLYVPPVSIFPLVIGYTIVRYGLFDVRMVRRRVPYAVLTAVLILIFALVATGVTATVGSVADNPWLTAIGVVVVALVFEPLRRWLQAGFDQMFFQKAVAVDTLLRSYSRELTTAVHMERVAALLLRYASEGIPHAHIQLYVPDDLNQCFISYNQPSGLMIPMEAPLVDVLQKESWAIDLSEELTWPAMLLADKERVDAMQSTLLVPMNNRTELFGWLALRPNDGRSFFSQHEISYLSALADQSIIGLERAAVVRSLENRVSELDQLSHLSEFLAYTVHYDDLYELVYTNYRRLLDISDFYIALKVPGSQRLYMACVIENDERFTAREGKAFWVMDEAVTAVVQSRQPKSWLGENGRMWQATPLNIGRATIGALYICLQPGQHAIRPQQARLFDLFADRTAVALDRLQTNQQLENRARQLEIINQVTLSLASTIDLDPLLTLMMTKAMELLDTQAGTIMLTDPNTGELEFHVVRGPAKPDLLGKRLPLGAGLAGTAAQTGQPIIVNNVQQDNRWFGEIDDKSTFQSESILTVPMLRHNTVQGVIQVINKKNGIQFDKEDEQLLKTFASQAVVVMENARLLKQTDVALQRSVNELSLLQQLDRDLNISLSLETVLKITLERMLSISRGRAGCIVLLDDDGQPQVMAHRGYGDQLQPLLANADLRQTGLVGHVLSTGKPHMTGNVFETPGYFQINYETKSQMTLPFVHQQNLIGVIVVESEQMDAFNPRDVETAVRITTHAAIAIANALLYEKVNEANLAKSEFVSMVSHELKTPMTAIRGYVDLMLTGVTGELTAQQHEFLETIAANSRRMGQQIQDLTDISRIETNHLHMELVPTQLTAVVDETLNTIRSLCAEKSITLHIDLPDELPLVLGDKGRLSQVLTNLLSNACKYSPATTNIYVSFRRGEQHDQPVICATVRDEGYGISEEDQQKLFTKFFRSQDPNIRQSKGTGLGLSITKGIIELHGGEMWVESALGQGTAFHFTLPIATSSQ